MADNHVIVLVCNILELHVISGPLAQSVMQ